MARRTGVSHNAAYRHFADREELLAEVAQAGQDLLSHAMASRVARLRGGDRVQRSRRRLREIGKAYVLFAIREPGLFAAAFSHPGAEASDVPGPYEMLAAALDEMVASGAASPEHRDGAEVVCWSAVHGFAVLHVDGPLKNDPARPRDRQLDAIEQGIR